MAENALEQLQKSLDSDDQTVTEDRVAKAYGEAKNTHFQEYLKKGGASEEYQQKEKDFLEKLEALKNRQLEKVRILSQKKMAGKQEIAKDTSKQRDMARIEQEQTQLSNAAKAASQFTVFPTSRIDVMRALATEETINYVISKGLEKYAQELAKAGLNTEENQKILKAALLEAALVFKEQKYDLEASINILKTNLETFLHGLDDLYEKEGKNLFASPLDMLINFSNYSQTNVVGIDKKFNKENLKTFLQYNASTFATYLSGYQRYLVLEKRKRELRQSPSGTPTILTSPQALEKPAAEILMATATVLPPDAPKKPEPKTPFQESAPPPPKPEAHPTATPSITTSIMDGFKEFLKVVGDFFNVDILSWFGWKETQTFSPEIVELTKNLGHLDESAKSALNAMIAALLTMTPFGTVSGKTNLLAKLKTLFADETKTKAVLGKKPPLTPWGDWLKEKLDPKDLEKLASNDTFSASEIATTLTPKT